MAYRNDRLPSRSRAGADRVAIIGGGVTGALSAARLAARGFHVVLLEKAAIGNGSSSRSLAGIRAQFGTEESVIGMLFSEWWYTHFHEHLATPPERRQPVIKPNGYLFLYDDPNAPDAAPTTAQHWVQACSNVAMQQRLGLAVEALTPGQVAERWPHLTTQRLSGATWCPSDGFLYPHVIYGEGIRRAEELGATILQWSAVLGARVNGQRLTVLETTRGPVDVDWVVNCTNAWAPRVSQLLGGASLPIRPIKRFLYHLDVGGALSANVIEQLPMTIYGMGTPFGAHTRPDGGHLILAGTHEAAAEPEFTDADQDLVPAQFDHRHGTDNFGYQLLAEMARYAPTLAEGGGLFATTCGYYGMTADALPLIGFDPRLSNLVHAAGFSGHGVMHAPISALLVESLVAGDIQDGHVRLPPPFDRHRLDMAAFAAARDFATSRIETAVL